MTPDQIRSVIRRYRTRLAEKGVEARRHSEGTLCMRNTNAPLAHVAWMLERMERFLDEERIEKAMRWLGFVQGTLWMDLSFTIADLKTHNTSENGQ